MQVGGSRMLIRQVNGRAGSNTRGKSAGARSADSHQPFPLCCPGGNQQQLELESSPEHSQEKEEALSLFLWREVFIVKLESVWLLCFMSPSKKLLLLRLKTRCCFPPLWGIASHRCVLLCISSRNKGTRMRNNYFASLGNPFGLMRQLPRCISYRIEIFTRERCCGGGGDWTDHREFFQAKILVTTAVKSKTAA